MTHIPEDEFAVTVRAWLEYHYAAEMVESEVVLPSARRADFVVETPVGNSLAIEIENERRGTYESVGQALAYANELTDRRRDTYLPVVVVPRHGLRALDMDYLTREVEFVRLSSTWSPP